MVASQQNVLKVLVIFLVLVLSGGKAVGEVLELLLLITQEK
ncbi:hypothetical protein [Pontibacter cellulosilyticus]|nr:hypothetical protein [Pontibacter cellulosilyticus]